MAGGRRGEGRGEEKESLGSGEEFLKERSMDEAGGVDTRCACRAQTSRAFVRDKRPAAPRELGRREAQAVCV